MAMARARARAMAMTTVFESSDLVFRVGADWTKESVEE